MAASSSSVNDIDAHRESLSWNVEVVDGQYFVIKTSYPVGGEKSTRYSNLLRVRLASKRKQCSCRALIDRCSFGTVRDIMLEVVDIQNTAFFHRCEALVHRIEQVTFHANRFAQCLVEIGVRGLETGVSVEEKMYNTGSMGAFDAGMLGKCKCVVSSALTYKTTGSLVTFVRNTLGADVAIDKRIFLAYRHVMKKVEALTDSFHMCSMIRHLQMFVYQILLTYPRSVDACGLCAMKPTNMSLKEAGKLEEHDRDWETIR